MARKNKQTPPDGDPKTSSIPASVTDTSSVTQTEGVAESVSEPTSVVEDDMSFKWNGKGGERLWIEMRGFNYMKVIMYLGAGAGIIKIISKMLEVGIW